MIKQMSKEERNASKQRKEANMTKKKTQEPEVQEVRVVNEKPSIGSRIAEYGLFAIIWHGIGLVFSAIFE